MDFFMTVCRKLNGFCCLRVNPYFPEVNLINTLFSEFLERYFKLQLKAKDILVN